MNNSIWFTIFILAIITSCILICIFSIINIIILDIKVADQAQTINKLQSVDKECFGYFEVEKKQGVCSLE